MIYIGYELVLFCVVFLYFLRMIFGLLIQPPRMVIFDLAGINDELSNVLARALYQRYDKIRHREGSC